MGVCVECGSQAGNTIGSPQKVLCARCKKPKPKELVRVVTVTIPAALLPPPVPEPPPPSEILDEVEPEDPFGD